ncbi:hypothetical protein BASA82_000511 [Batrachochytrium salamandrivorans]|nr:hypothetical protein BASA81_003358 [Batrachochytrium salamandrivorans]KAH9262424.1 hypothetical protein BASA82_000511 [Batrachochytrium salamandrivorans]
MKRLLQADETALDMLKRSGYGRVSAFPKFGVAELDRLLPQTVSSPLVIEIEGESGSGKSFLLQMLASTLVAAASPPSANVLYFNLDKRLRPHSFAGFTSQTNGNEVFIVSPDDCIEFLLCLHHMTAAHTIRLVVIDSLLSLYEFSALTDPLGSGFPVSIPRVLFDLGKKLGFAVAAAKPVPRGGSVGGEEICSETWNRNVSLKIALKPYSPHRHHQQTARGGEVWDAKTRLELGKFSM